MRRRCVSGKKKPTADLFYINQTSGYYGEFTDVSVDAVSDMGDYSVSISDGESFPNAGAYDVYVTVYGTGSYAKVDGLYIGSITIYRAPQSISFSPPSPLVVGESYDMNDYASSSSGLSISINIPNPYGRFSISGSVVSLIDYFSGTYPVTAYIDDPNYQYAEATASVTASRY
jgi:hypothetical protein